LDESQLTESLDRGFGVCGFEVRGGGGSDLLAKIETIAAGLMVERYGDRAWHERR